MLVTRDEALARRARVMRLHGMSRDAFDRFTATVPSWYYEIVAPGFKYNLTDIAAALGIHQLKKANAFQRRREAIARRYHEAFGNCGVVVPPDAPPGELHAWHLYAARLAPDSGVSRDRFIERMFEQGIGCSVHYIPLHLHPYWRERYGLNAALFPHSQRAYEQMVSLPIYTRMSDADVERVVATVKASLSG
jgi:dTDP-4-amino-4,6-dideoxygalactose transaminase